MKEDTYIGYFSRNLKIEKLYLVLLVDILPQLLPQGIGLGKKSLVKRNGSLAAIIGIYLVPGVYLLGMYCTCVGAGGRRGKGAQILPP